MRKSSVSEQKVWWQLQNHSMNLSFTHSILVKSDEMNGERAFSKKKTQIKQLMM